MKRTLFTMRMLASMVMSFVALMASADEYIDPQTNVVYTYQPGQTNASVNAGYEVTIDWGYGYELEVEYYSGSPDAAGDVVILDRFTVGTEEYVVTSIGYAAFRENRHIKSVSIPETVTDIASSAFSLCDSLRTVQLPEGLTRVAHRLFAGCSQLVSVVIPSSVSIIDGYAFNYCVSLASLTLPAGLTRIGKGAFEGTPWYASLYDEAPEGPFYIGSSLLGYKGDKPTGELVIKEGTTYIGYGAFINCGGLTSVTIPESVTYVDQSAFENCSGLTAVHIKDLAAWCGIEFQWGYTQKSSNPLCYAHHLYLNGEVVSDLVIPEGVTSIGSYAFDGCTDLTSVTIPNGVTNIGTYAFRECSNLTCVTIPPSMATIGEMAFIWCFDLNAVHISDLAAWCSISFFYTANPLYYGAHLYLDDKEVNDLIIPEGVTTIGNGTFRNYSRLTTVVIPNSVTEIGEYAFYGCSDMTSVTIGNNVNSIGQWAFSGCQKLMDVYCYAKNVPYTENDVFYNTKIEDVTLHVPAASVSAYQTVEPWKNFKQIVALAEDNAYRPFVEDDKVWKVGDATSGSPVQWVEYFYFDGDTIVDGKTCKQMMCQRYISPDYPGYDYYSQRPSLNYVGAWYEEDKKVYFSNAESEQLTLMYDFSVDANDTIEINNMSYVIGPKQTGGKEGFKGVYRNVRLWEDGVSYYSIPWLEGVGGTDRPTTSVYPGVVDPLWFLMSCTVGDEVIYFVGAEDGATPEEIYAPKGRFDFSHTIKTKPQAPMRRGEEQALYGEYNDLRLGINLDPLDDAYQVRIADETGKIVYEKAVNAGNIVGLNIDISAYAKGRYTVTVENSQEVFTGEFDTQTTEMREVRSKRSEVRSVIYNLQGQRLSALQKGLNIVNGQKVFVK